VLELEQYLSGDLVAQIRIPIEDTTGVDDVREAGNCTVALPTYGQGVASQVTLLTRDGALLDRRGPHPLAERVDIRVVVDGVEESPIVLGGDQAPLGLEDREARRRLVDEQVAQLAAQGAQGRLLVDKMAADERLRVELRAAQGELLVHDPYFGQSADDWRLLHDVSVPAGLSLARRWIRPPRSPLMSRLDINRTRPRCTTASTSGRMAGSRSAAPVQRSGKLRSLWAASRLRIPISSGGLREAVGFRPFS
jgi:hypothetical protein